MSRNNGPQQHDSHVRDWLVMSCRDMVWYETTRMWRRGQGRRVGAIEDLAAEGMLGLVRAARSYSAEYVSGRTGRPVAFITYAVHVVRRWLQQAENHYGLVTLPYSRRRMTEKSRMMASRAWTTVPISPKNDRGVDDEPTALEAVEEEGRMLQALEQLPPRQQSILRERFWGGKTLRGVALAMGVTKERIRQLEIKALQRLREIMGVGA